MSMATWLVYLVTVAAADVSVAQTRVQNPPAQQPTGSIAGIITTDDTGTVPVRRAVVTIRGERSGEANTTTDQDGRFTMTGLTADRYAIYASKPSYINGTFGGGQPLALADGEHRSIVLRMPKGGVISGSVIGPDGLPATGVTVTALRPTTVGGERYLVGSALTPAAQSDDQGRYRIWGLPTGKYVVVAKATAGMPRDLTIAGGDESATPRNVTYAPVYWPGTSDIDAARQVQVTVGETVSGIDVPIRLVPAATVMGSVQTEDDAAPGAALRLVLTRASTGLAPYDGGEIVNIDTQRRFEIRGLAPGRYILRALYAATTSSGAPAPAGGGTYWATQFIDVNGSDVKDVAVSLRRGIRVTGSLMQEKNGETPLLDPAAVTMRLESLNVNGVRPVDPQTVRPDSKGAFAFESVAPGRYRVMLSFPQMNAQLIGWSFKHAAVAGTVLANDILEVNADAPPTPLEVVLTARPTEVAGRLLVGDGTPAPGYAIVVFAANESFWTPSTRMVKSARPATDGHFKFVSLPAGEYLLCAVTQLNTLDLTDPEFLRSLVGAALKLQVAEGEQKTLSLKAGSSRPPTP